MERQHIAYLLMILVAIAATMLGVYLRHNSPRRKEQRQRRRDKEAYQELMDAKRDTE